MYPIRLKPIIKQHIWGGHKLLEIKRGDIGRLDPNQTYGESWDISGLDGNISVISNGFLKGNNLQEAIEVYMGDLVGEGVFDRYGLEFPLLVKWLDCDDRISIQVHPNDEIAAERHASSGKSEMWYIVDAEPGAKIYVGFKNSKITREEYIKAVAEGRIEEIIQSVDVKKGDVFFIPAGTIHSISGGIRIVEIQQPVDLTYRVFDWNRVAKNGRSRELHTALAVDAIDFESTWENCRRNYIPIPNKAVELVKCDYFTTNLISLQGGATMDYCRRDSFVIYVCVEGEATLSVEEHTERLKAGQTILIPAECNEVVLSGNATILESYLE